MADPDETTQPIKEKKGSATLMAEVVRTMVEKDGTRDVAAVDDRKNERRAYQIVIALLAVAVLVLAGHAVGVDVPGLGSFSGGQ